MQKTIDIAVIACLLFAFSVTNLICPTAGAGIGERITVSQDLAVHDNCISDGSLTQVSEVNSGGTNEGGGPDENDDESDDDSGGGNDNPGGEDNGPGGGDDAGPGGDGGDDSNGPKDEPSDETDENPSDETGSFETLTVGQGSGNPADAVVINEVHPVQKIAIDNKDEMVELYNAGRNPVNVSLWYIKNLAGQVIGTIPENRIIPPHGFLLVEVNGLIGDRQRVGLFNSMDEKIDSVIYLRAKSHEGLCYARIPDGSNNWEWTTCTLGSSNQRGSPG